MTVFSKKLRRDIFSSKGMLLAIIAIISVGIGCMIGSLCTFSNLNLSKVSYYSQCRMADFWVKLKKAPVSSVNLLQNIKGISSLRDRIVFSAIIDLEDVERPLSGLVVSLPADPKPIINNIVLRKGSYFTEHRRDEVIVSEKFAHARNISPGMYIHLIMNGQRKKLFVVGTAISSEFMYLTPPGGIAPDPYGYGVFWIKREYAEDIFGFHGACNDVVGLLSPEARRNPEAVLKQISTRLDAYGVFTTTALKDQKANLALNAEMSGLRQMATVLPMMFLGVAILVLNVVMLRLAEQQRTVIGTLKALGHSNRTIFFHYIQFGIFVGFAGGVAGIFIGYWFASNMTELYQTYFTFPNLYNRMSPQSYLAGLLLSVCFAIAGTYRGVKKVIYLNPSEAMRPPPPQTGGSIWLETIPRFWQCLDFRWQIVLRGIFRNKGRTLVSLFAASMGAALVFMALGMGDSLKYMVDFQFNKVMLSNFNINLREEAGFGAFDEVERLPGVTYVEPTLDVSCTFHNGSHYKKGAITGITQNARLTVPRDTGGKRVQVPPTGLLMTKRLAKILNVKTGDRITFIPIKGIRHPHVVRVEKIIDSTFGLAVYADYGFLNNLIRQEAAITSLQILARQNESQRQAFLERIKQYPKLGSLSDVNEEKQQLRKEFVGSMESMGYVMIVFAAVIFFGSILNASLIAIAERQREIATFRVLGYQSLEVGAIFLRETLTVNMLGALFGLPLGYWMLNAMAKQFRNDIYSMPCKVETVSWFLTIILTFVFVVAANVIIQRTINKMDWGEALKMKE